MRLHKALCTGFLLPAIAIFAPAGQGYVKLPYGVLLHLDSMNVRLQVCSERIVRVSVSTGNFDFHPSIVIVRNWQPVRWQVVERDSLLAITTGRLAVHLNQKSGAATFFDGKGRLLLREDPFRPHQLTPAVVAGEHVFHNTERFRLSNDEGIYGLGQFEYGFMNYRNHHITLIQNNRHIVAPFLLSSRDYGIYWDNYSHTEFNDGPDGMSLWSEVADGIDYYVIAGRNPDDVIAGLRDMTGQAPMWPRWAFGYWQSKERYENENDLMSAAREYRSRHIPIDVIVQDWQYWGRLGWNAMAFDDSLYPDPKGMIDSLHRLYNLQLMISIWPQVDTSTAVYRELQGRRLLYPTEIWNGGKTYDAYSPEARDIFWKYLNKGLYALGVDAWWVDATEPDWKWCDSLLEEKEGIVRNGMTAIGTSSRYLNTYALMATTGIFRHQRAANPARRVVMLTRSAFVGEQRNSAAVWSGDISSTWSTFRNQIADGVNFCMAGIPYWNSDIGGFLPKEFGGEYPMGPSDPAYRELYVRWFEFGAFCPVFRSHGTDFPKEVWRFGEPGTWAYDALVKYINLRYRLLPYIYSTAWQVTSDGYTMMRGLPMDFRRDPKALNNGEEYMFGPAFLVAPVTECMYYPRLRGKIIPSDDLRTPDNLRGLLGHYYQGEKFDTLKNVRRDTVVHFVWSDIGAPGVGKDSFSVRWTGKIRAPETGRYQFETISDDGVNLFINGRQLMDEMYPGGLQTNYADIDLAADSVYDIVFEYYQVNEGAQVSLTWRTPSMQAGYRPHTKIGDAVVYLPQGAGWYDFWTGDRMKGGEEVSKPVPVDVMPLYVRAGSIVPMGPYLQYANERPADTLEIRVYRGGNGSFTLYEDQGDGYQYENGAYSVIPFRWDQKRGTLTIGSRKGSFPGMLKQRWFSVVFVAGNHGAGVEPTGTADRLVFYTGAVTTVKPE